MDNRLETRLAAVIATVSALESGLKDPELLSVGVAIRKTAEKLGVNDTTTRADVLMLLAEGRLVQVSHVGRRLLFPWPAQDEEAPTPWVNGAVKRGWYEITDHRQPGPAMAKVRFLFTPERLAAVMKRLREADASEKAEVQEREQRRREAYAAESAARDAEEKAAFREHYPVLADLLERLHAQVHVPGRSAMGVRVDVQENRSLGALGRVSIEVTDERFGALEAILRDGLGERGEELP
ncbi:hypothetical protein [Actinacidiphila sp. ITFR-21]|uniref:hypothetical protein n=1 Tax=Actinacidiphila sp. ITFR-21 TaxID=3075199 RepID=UPI00288940DB|nr:hypothetical protein [Streptomyces sp. ITFR-21]WNI17561.1 hypothetical protein RLT57_19925 [Streptomyces sp. ITFR-21]WNI17701.1 hypothetical protein RLT57_20640 [Streptomyces sp. ITFR-21]